ncbi:hypothetical protein BGZ83_004490 [Gryganskiella cystojenkinii]|nr:hypothetical protein BGZ83_004490 [Gryganskiella cystojenkinii]
MGAAMALGPTILPALEQLGLLEEMKKFSLPCNELHLYDSNMERLGTMRMKGQKEIDNTYYDGDILVGADGTYSAVRQNLYRDMEKLGILPKSDSKGLTAGYTCMVGVTDPLDPERYPQLKDEFVHFATVQGGVNYTWNVINTSDQRICWGLGLRFKNEEEAKRQQFANSEWGPEANTRNVKTRFCAPNMFRDFPCPYGGTLGDLIDKTPEDLISKVFLEYKLFKTWFHGRTVLLGDGKFYLRIKITCLVYSSRRSMLPSSGQGAVNAMQDAVILANCLYDLRNNKSLKGITAAFQSYYDQRFSHAKTEYGRSILTEKIFSGQRWNEKLYRKILFNYLPHVVQQKSFETLSMYRPQATFIPMVPFRGTGSVLPQLQSKRYQKEQAEKKKREQAAVTV